MMATVFLEIMENLQCHQAKTSLKVRKAKTEKDPPFGLLGEYS
jgi:hypothetical protein